MRELPDDKKSVEGFDLRRFEQDHVYDVSPIMAEVLIVTGYADPEMRRERDTADEPGPRRRRSERDSSR